MAMDKDVKHSLVTSAGYQAAYNAFDLHTFWNVEEQVVVERGAISVYSLMSFLLRCSKYFNISFSEYPICLISCIE